MNGIYVLYMYMCIYICITNGTYLTHTHTPTQTLLAGSLTFSERMRFAGSQVL